MTYCSYDNLLEVLKSKGVEFTEPLPNCPKHLDYVCMDMAGKCTKGNEKNCSQNMQFFIDNRLFQINVVFCYEKDSRIGFVRKEDLSVKNLLVRNIITEEELQLLA